MHFANHPAVKTKLSPDDVSSIGRSCVGVNIIFSLRTGIDRGFGT
jgi:hypothetical protein